MKRDASQDRKYLHTLPMTVPDAKDETRVLALQCAAAGNVLNLPGGLDCRLGNDGAPVSAVER